MSQTYYQRGNAYKLNKNYKAAVKDYTEAIKLNPNNKDAYWDRAYCNSFLLDYKTSAEDYTETMAFYKDDRPRLALLYNSRAIVEFWQNMFDNAIKDDSIAIDLNPGLEGAYTAQGDAYNKNGNYNLAIKVYQMGLNFQSNSKKYNSMLYRLIAENEYGLHKYEDVVANCSKAIELDPQNMPAYFWRAKAFMLKLNNSDQGMADFNKVMQLDTVQKSYDCMYSLYYTGKADEAIRKLENMIVGAGNIMIERNASYNLACIYALMNKTSEANDYLKAAIRKGYSKKIAMLDENLENIRNTDDYKSIIGDGK